MSINPQASAAGGEIGPIQGVIKKNIQETFGPQATVAQTPVKFCGQADSTKFGLVKFGMERSPHAGCCVKRFMGGAHGCCKGIKSGKPFEREYIKAVERNIKEKGEMPTLKPEVIEKLKGMQIEGEKHSEFDRLQKLAKAHASKKPKALLDKEGLSASDRRLLTIQKKIIRVISAPFRWIKWLAVSFKADMINLWHKAKHLLVSRRA
jgi:hypothetical protein